MLQLQIRRSLGAFRLDVAIEAPAPGVVALFGRSGSGKTSIIQAVAGLLRPESGRIAVGDTVLFDSARGIDLPPEKRRIGYVFQDARLFPHMSVARNLAYGLKRAPAGERSIGQDAVVDLLGIRPLLDRRPLALSGGERQRVALGRALLAQPRLLLMDEPLVALDAERKAEVLPYLEALHDRLALPILYVTHAMEEVTRLADTLVMVEAGRVLASGPLAAVLSRTDLSALTGHDDALNVLQTVVDGHDPARGLTRLAFDGGNLLLPLIDRPAGAGLRVRIAARDIILATKRPEAISLRNILDGQVTGLTEGRGGAVLVTLMLGPTPLIARITRDAAQDLGLSPGMPVYVLVKSVAVDR